MPAKRPFLRGLAVGVCLPFLLAAIVLETRIPDLLAMPLLRDDTTGSADAIVVLGAGVDDSCEPNVPAFRRTVLAARLCREGRAPVVLFTGGMTESGGPCPSADAMAALARELGIPADRIFVERGSRSTWENAHLSAALLRPLDVRRILLVTDCLHMARAEGCFRTMGFEIERASVPATQAYHDNIDMLTSAFHEYLGLLYYALAGRFDGRPEAS